MEIEVDRFVSDSDTTLSSVSVVKAERNAVFWSKNFICFGLEDEFRETKVPKETRIPAGTYEIRLRTFGSFHERYQKRFPTIHAGMLEICNVPGFTDILIHCGNTDEDTAGCLLVGTGCITKFGEMSLINSTSAYVAFYTLIIKELIFNKKDHVKITFIDND